MALYIVCAAVVCVISLVIFAQLTEEAFYTKIIPLDRSIDKFVSYHIEVYGNKIPGIMKAGRQPQCR